MSIGSVLPNHTLTGENTIMVHINRDGTDMGKHTMEEVLAGLREGRFQGADLAWQPGMETWLPLSQFPEVKAVGGAHAGATAEGIPFENRAELGFLKGMRQTIKGVLFSPRQTFRAMDFSRGTGSAALFYVLTGWVGVMASLLWNVAFQGMLFALGLGGAPEGELAGTAAVLGLGLGFMVVGFTLFMPVLLFVGSYVMAAFTYVWLMIFRAATAGYGPTYRVIAYAYGAGSLFNIVPFVGGMIGGIWSLIALVSGLSEVHGVSALRIVMALIVVPFILIIAVVVAIVAFAVSMGGENFGAF